MANEYTKAVLYGIQNFNDKVKEKAYEVLQQYIGKDKIEIVGEY